MVKRVEQYDSLSMHPSPSLSAVGFEECVSDGARGAPNVVLSDVERFWVSDF